MGAKPGKLCELREGKIIDAQRGFVATFNWMKDFCNNLAGDANLEAEEGAAGIKVDTSVSDHPVIRLVGVGDGDGDGAAEVTVVGTDGTEAVCTTGRITFASAEDSNVVVVPSADSAGNVTVKIGVYYK